LAVGASGSGFGVWGVCFRFWGFGVGFWALPFERLGLGLRVCFWRHRTGLRVEGVGSEFMGYGLVFQDQGLGFRDWGSGFRVCDLV